MERARIRVAGVVIAALTLSACGGGSGGGSPDPSVVPTTALTNWRTDAVANAKIHANGIGRQVSYQYDCGTTADCSSGKVTSIGTPSGVLSVKSLFFFDASGNLELLQPVDSQSGFTTTQISSLAANTKFVTGQSATGRAIVSDPKNTAWDYQSFGVWESGLGDANRTFGVMSVGATTPSDKVPTSGTATFNGNIIGSYVNAGGEGHAVLSNLEVVADFGAHTLDFTSSGTRISKDWTNFNANGSLDLSGTLTISPNGTFSGTLTTGTLSGESNGTFYGPAAQELGGVFYLTNPDSTLETYAGAYGASAP